jgi:hypothetical protein
MNRHKILTHGSEASSDAEAGALNCRARGSLSRLYSSRYTGG